MDQSKSNNQNGEAEWTRRDSPVSGEFRLIPAVFTPFNQDGTLDHQAVERYVAHLESQGIREVFLNGTTGESLSLTVDERISMVETWSRYRDKLNLIVHVGHNCQVECIRMAGHAQQLGIRTIAAMSPAFFRPDDERTMVDFLAPIAAAAPDAGFYFYHIPSMTGMPLVMDKFIANATQRIPNFVGVKYTHEDLSEYQRCLERWGSQINLLFGRDELLLEALTVGARGAVGSYYSIIPRVFQQMAVSHSRGEPQTAKACAEYAVRYISLTSEQSGLPASKFLLSQLGVMSAVVRPPLTTLDAKLGSNLQQQLAEFGTPPRSGRPGLPSPHTDQSTQHV